MIELHVNDYKYSSCGLFVTFSSGDPRYNDCLTLTLSSMDVYFHWDDEDTYAIIKEHAIEKFCLKYLL